MSSFAEYQSNQIIKENESKSKTNIKNSVHKYSILSFLNNNKNIKENINSHSNSFNSIKKYNFDAYLINKFDEINTSFSNISFFDLECQEEKDLNSSFNSLENSFEENKEKSEEIIINLKVQNDLDEAKYIFELNKEYEEIEKNILNIKN